MEDKSNWEMELDGDLIKSDERESTILEIRRVDI